MVRTFRRRNKADWAQIYLRCTTKNVLVSLKRGNDTFDDVVNRLMDSAREEG